MVFGICVGGVLVVLLFVIERHACDAQMEHLRLVCVCGCNVDMGCECVAPTDCDRCCDVCVYCAWF